MRISAIKKSIIRISALILAVLMLFSSCSDADESGVKTVKSVKSRNTITSECETPELTHYSVSAAAFTEKAASSGLIELFIDKSTNTFCVADAEKKHMWSVLPLLDSLSQNEAHNSEASMATVKVIGGTDIYYLNTQDNSLKFGKAGYKLIENGAEFNFDLFTDEQTAAKEKLSPSDIAFNLKIRAMLIDGSMTVECEYSNLSGNNDAYIESIELLNYFGAFNDSFEEDFLLVPDGCGATIRTSIFDESFEPLSFAVYGSDPSCPNDYSGSAVVPAFGIKHGEAAFVSLIQQGDACAVIHADKASDISGYNMVYPSFEITTSDYDGETLYVSKSSEAHKLSLCYRFLFDKNATYSGLASACREQLIRNSVLSVVPEKEVSYLPFFLTLTGAVKKNLGPFSYLSKLTTFDQARDMLTRMKNKGINNIALRYCGAFSGGTEQNDIKNASVLARLGGRTKLSDLYEYISAQKMSLYLDIDILSNASGFGGNAVSDIHKKVSSYAPASKLSDAVGREPSTRELRKISRLSNVINSVLADTKLYDFSGFCLNDAGSLLYSDQSFNGSTREQAAEAISSAITPLSTSRSTMAVGGNFFMLRKIDSVINVPLDTSVPTGGAYTAIPFVQLILHGTVDYAGKPINTRINLEESLLRCIEFGACPHFEWNYEPISRDTENDIFYYDNTINSAAEFYKKADNALSDLRSARMTDHYEVSDGIYCTEYDTGAMIYVNFTDSEYTVMGAVVEARDFLRVG